MKTVKKRSGGNQKRRISARRVRRSGGGVELDEGGKRKRRVSLFSDLAGGVSKKNDPEVPGTYLLKQKKKHE